MTSSAPETLEEFAKFNEAFKKVRMNNQVLSIDEVIDISRGLSAVLSIDSLPRALLLNICRYMQIRPFGTDAFIRRQIRSKMNSLQVDDLLIDQEGVENLTYEELVNACHSRGIRAFGTISRPELEKQLLLWLDLHLRSEIPAILIILSRALSMFEPEVGTNEALQQAIMSLPENIVADIAQDSSEESHGAFQRKIDALEKQQDLIQQELEENVKASVDPDMIRPEDVESLSEALSKLSSSNTSESMQQLDELKSLKDDMAELKEDLVSIPRADKALELEGKLENLMNDIEQELGKLDDASSSPLRLSISEDDVITRNDLEKLLRTLRTANFSDQKITRLFNALDTDHDGKIRIKDIVHLGNIIENQRNGMN